MSVKENAPSAAKMPLVNEVQAVMGAETSGEASTWYGVPDKPEPVRTMVPPAIAYWSTDRHGCRDTGSCYWSLAPWWGARR